MPGRYLLDTNIVIGLLAGEETIQKKLGAAEEIFLPSIVVGELYYGDLNSTHSEENVARVDDFAASCTVLSCDASTAREYGYVKQELRTRGRPIPENDIWVAAIARQYGLVLATRDEHFAAVQGLTREVW